jgi:hypothetical protein
MPELKLEWRWLLDRVAQLRAPIRLVLPETRDQIFQWNAPCPRWRTKDVFAALRELEGLGWIQFDLRSFADDREIVAVSQPSFDHRELVDAYKRGQGVLSYMLTAAGAAIWEQAAQPNWNLSYDVEFDARTSSEEEEAYCCATALHEDVVRQALLIRACGGGWLAIPGTERYAPCGEWNATYWKKFAAGIRGTVGMSRALDQQIHNYLPLSAQRREGESCNHLHRWFTRADHPDWQRLEYLLHGGMWQSSE